MGGDGGAPGAVGVAGAAGAGGCGGGGVSSRGGGEEVGREGDDVDWEEGQGAVGVFAGVEGTGGGGGDEEGRRRRREEEEGRGREEEEGREEGEGEVEGVGGGSGAEYPGHETKGVSGCCGAGGGDGRSG